MKIENKYDITVLIDQNKIVFKSYPFEASNLFVNNTLVNTDIEFINIENRFPPEIRTNKNEVLFISAEQKDELNDFAKMNQIPEIEKADIWSILLDPFLDTEISEERKRKLIEELINLGLTEDKIQEIWSQVSEQMYKYNQWLWEWVHFSHYDLLSAMQDGLTQAEYRTFYWDSMELAH